MSNSPTPVQVYMNSSQSTEFLNGTYKSNLIYYFSSPIVPPLGYNMTLRVVNMYLPISFTILNDDNNTFTLNGVDYTITNGNYSATTLATEIMDIVAGDEPSFTVSFDSITNKYTFSNDTDFTIDGTCLYILGFSDSATSSSSTLTSTYPVDLTGDNIIYLDVKNLTTFNLSSSTGSRTSIVKSVLVNVPYGSVLYVEDTSSTAFTLGEDHLSFVHVRLLAEDAETLLDLNNMDWSVTIEIGFTPKTVQPNLPESFRETYTNYLRSLM